MTTDHTIDYHTTPEGALDRLLRRLARTDADMADVRRRAADLRNDIDTWESEQLDRLGYSYSSDTAAAEHLADQVRLPYSSPYGTIRTRTGTARLTVTDPTAATQALTDAGRTDCLTTRVSVADAKKHLQPADPAAFDTARSKTLDDQATDRAMDPNTGAIIDGLLWVSDGRTTTVTPTPTTAPLPPTLDTHTDTPEA